MSDGRNQISRRTFLNRLAVLGSLMAAYPESALAALELFQDLN